MEEKAFSDISEQEDISDEVILEDPSESAEETQRREYDELIRTKYKKFYTEDTQKMINRRFRKYKELEARAETLEAERAQLEETLHAQKVQFEETLKAETNRIAKETEERLISSIRARHTRPEENGILIGKAQGKRDVSSLTRSERAELARRVSKGESIKI